MNSSDIKGLEILVKEISSDLRKLLEKIKIKNFTVEDRIQEKDVKEYENCLMFGEPRISDDFLALMISSQDSFYNNIPIKTVYIPLTNLELFSLNKENTKIGDNFFYIVENEKIIPVLPSKPVPLDGLLIFRDNESYHGPRNILINSSYIQRFTNNKIATKLFLKKQGIKVPFHKKINKIDSYGPVFQLCNFIEKNKITDFVVKANEGSCGDEVALFNDKEIEDAIEFMNMLLRENERVYVDQRINPLIYKDIDGKIIDWNIRAFVTLEDDPQWVDGIVRLSKRNGSPVNISKGADVAELNTFCDITNISEDFIKQYSVFITKLIYDRAKSKSEINAGWLGLDLIVGNDGVYLIEANDSQAGAFAELCMLRQKPLESVKNILMPSIGKFLYKNHCVIIEEELNIAHGLTKEEHNWLGNKFIELNDLDSAIEQFNKALEKDGKFPDALWNKANVLIKFKKYENVVSELEKILEINPDISEINELIGDCYFELKDFYKASESFKQAIQKILVKHSLERNSKNLIYKLALSYWRTCDFEGTSSALFILFTLDKNHEKGNCLLSDYLRTKDFYAALEHLLDAVSEMPESFDLRKKLADLLYDYGNLDEALGYYKELVEKTGLTDKSTNLRYAETLAFQGNFEEAEKQFKIIGVSDVRTYYFMLGGFLRARKRTKEAKMIFNRILELDPKYKLAKEQLKIINKLERANKPSLKARFFYFLANKFHDYFRKSQGYD